MANADLIRGLYDRFTRGDINGILELLDPGVEWGSNSVASEVPWLTWRKGIDEVRGFFTVVGSNLDIDVFRIDQVIEQGDAVAVKLRIEGTLRKNARRIAYDALHLWQLRQGKVVRYQQFDDTAAAREAWRG